MDLQYVQAYKSTMDCDFVLGILQLGHKVQGKGLHTSDLYKPCLQDIHCQLYILVYMLEEFQSIPANMSKPLVYLFPYIGYLVRMEWAGKGLRTRKQELII